MSARPARRLKFGLDARLALAEGIDIVARTVRRTLGPRGRLVVLDSRFGTPELSPSYIDRHMDSPILADDGHAISQEILIGDTFVNQGILLARDVARTAKRKLGDGSTTAIILTDAMVKRGLLELAGGAEPNGVSRGIDEAVAQVVTYVRRVATPAINGEIAQVAAAAAKGDDELAGLISEALHSAGGHIRFEASRSRACELSVSHELPLDRGLLTPAIVTDEERGEAALDDALVLLVDGPVTGARQLAPALGLAIEAGRPMIVVAEEFDADAMALLTVNFLQRRVTAVPIQSPSHGESRRELFEDVAAFTGASVVGGPAQTPLARVTIAELGGAERIVVRRRDTSILGGRGDATTIAMRSGALAVAAAEADNLHERDELDARRARLDGSGVVLVRIGGATETEIRGRTSAAEDALSAARAARRGGIVPGAGATMIAAASAVGVPADSDEAAGARLVARALEAPVRALAEGAGLDAGAVVEEMRRAPGFGPDLRNGGDMCDLAGSGIVDSAETLCIALESAAYYAKRVLGAEALVVQPIYAGRYDGTAAEGGPANLTMR